MFLLKSRTVNYGHVGVTGRCGDGVHPMRGLPVVQNFGEFFGEKVYTPWQRVKRAKAYPLFTLPLLFLC